MRLLAVLALALAAAPAALGATRSVTAPAAVTAVAFDGQRIAYAAGRGGADCDRVRIWSLRTRRVQRLGRTTACVETSTGTGIAAVALAGTRVLWLHYTGGNIREWRLFKATTTRARPRLLQTASAPVDDPAPLVLGDGDASPAGDLLPYALGSQVVVLRSNGTRAFAWRAPDRVVALDANAGKVAVATDGGLVTVLDADGRVRHTETFAGALSAVEVTARGVVAQRGRTLELRGDGGSRTRQVAAGSRLESALGSYAYYAARGQARELSLVGSLHRTIASGTRIATEGSSAAVAAGRRVVLVRLR